MSRTTVAVVFLYFLCFAAAMAKTYNVDVWGSDSTSCGAKTTPCETIQHAIDNASGGDRVVVGQGVFQQSGSPLLIIGKSRLKLESRNGAGATLIQRPDVGAVIQVQNSDRAVIGKNRKGFTFQTTTTPSPSNVAVLVVNSAAVSVEGNRIYTVESGVSVANSLGVKIRRNQMFGLDDGTFAGRMIRFATSHQGQVRDNLIYRSESNAIHLVDSEKVLISRNSIQDAGSIAIFADADSPGTRILDNATYRGSRSMRLENPEGLRVEKNVNLLDNGTGLFNGMVSVYHDGSGLEKGPIIKNNTIIGGVLDGLYLSNTPQASIEGNTIQQSSANGVFLVSSTVLSRLKNNNIHDTISGCATGGVALTVPYQNQFFGVGGPDSGPDSDGIDAVCNTHVGGTARNKPNPFRAKAAAKL